MALRHIHVVGPYVRSDFIFEEQNRDFNDSFLEKSRFLTIFIWFRMYGTTVLYLE